MAGSGNGEAKAPTPPPAGIDIRFPEGALGGVAVTIAPGTTDAQLYAAAWLLDAMAHEIRAQLQSRSAAAGLVPAAPDVLAALRQAGRL